MTTYTITHDHNFPNRHLVTRGGTRLGIIGKDICNGRVLYSATSLNTKDGFVGRYDSVEEAAEAIAATWPAEGTPPVNDTPHTADDCPICQTLEAEARENREAAAEADERLYRSYQQRISNLEYGIDGALETIADMHEDSDPRKVIETVRHYLTTYRHMQ